MDGQYFYWTELWQDQEREEDRRHELIDREIAGTISETEQEELVRLQGKMLARRREFAPLPLDDLRVMLELLGEDDEGNTSDVEKLHYKYHPRGDLHSCVQEENDR